MIPPGSDKWALIFYGGAAALSGVLTVCLIVFVGLVFG
jgi:hypothetical protein